MKLNIFTVIFLIGLNLISLNAQKHGHGLTLKDVKRFIQKNSKICIMETGATEDDLNDCLNNAKDPSRESKCLRYCLMKQFRMINLDNELSEKGVIAVAKQFAGRSNPDVADVAGEIARICAHKKTDDNCESAHRYARCIFKEIKIRGINLPN